MSLSIFSACGYKSGPTSVWCEPTLASVPCALESDIPRRGWHEGRKGKCAGEFEPEVAFEMVDAKGETVQRMKRMFNK